MENWGNSGSSRDFGNRNGTTRAKKGPLTNFLGGGKRGRGQKKKAAAFCQACQITGGRQNLNVLV